MIGGLRSSDAAEPPALSSRAIPSTRDQLNLSFLALNRAIDSQTRYYFVSCDVAGNAGGTLLGSIESRNSLSFVNGAIETSFSDLPLSAGTISFVLPSINISSTSLPGFGNVAVNTASAPQSYTVSATALQDDLVITAPAGFLLSLSSREGSVNNTITSQSRDFSQQLVLAPHDGSIAPTIVYVVFLPVSLGACSGNIDHSSPNAGTQTLAVSGTGIAASLDIPANLSISKTATEIVLQWDAVTNASSYRIFSSDLADGEFSLVGTTSSTEWRMPATHPRRFYYIRAYTD
jgi:hypothetical protein